MKTLYKVVRKDSLICTVILGFFTVSG